MPLEQAFFDQLRAAKTKSRANRHFLLRWLPREKRRIGIIVSKKIDKAYKRNAIKRVVREYFRLHPETFPLGDLLVIARPGLKGLSKKEIREKLVELL